MIKKAMQRTFALLLAGTLTAAACTTANAAEVDLGGTYHASMGIQTATEAWAEHMGYYASTYNKNFGTEKADKLISKDAQGNEQIHEATFTDVEIAGNGTYTLKLENADFLGETCISQLHIATDIPVNDQITFHDVKAVINDKTVLNFEEGWLENEEPYLEGGMVVVLLNHWRDELKEIVQAQGLSEDAENGYTLLNGTGKENISIQFTVDGFNYDNPDAVAETPEPSPAATSDSDRSGQSDGGLSSGAIAGIAIAAAVVIIGGIVIIIYRRRK